MPPDTMFGSMRVFLAENRDSSVKKRAQPSVEPNIERIRESNPKNRAQLTVELEKTNAAER